MVRLGALLVLLCAPYSSFAQTSLKDLSLEELMNLDVTSVSRRIERVWDTAAAISVITQDDLHRAGVTSLAEALRLAGGVAVARQSNRTWAISTRGFQITTANKLQVLIDGRSVYTPLFSGVFWDVQDTMLEDVERIEIIRGPGASIWGANAVNGVINVITRHARDSHGTIVDLIGGNEERGAVGARYGRRLGAVGHYRVYAKYFDRDAMQFPSGADAQDPHRDGRAGFRLDATRGTTQEVSIQGQLYRGAIGQFENDDVDVSGGHVILRWTHRFNPRSEVQAQAYYDRTYRRIPEQFEETRGTYDVDVVHRWRPTDRHDIVYGGAYRLTRDITTPSEALFFEPPDRSSPLLGLFAQDEIALQPQTLFLTVGSRFEESDYTSGIEVQPTLRLRWTPRRYDQTIWGAVSRAVRMPTRLDEDLHVRTNSVVTLRGDPQFDSEKLRAYELGYRVRPVSGLSLDIAAFIHDFDDLRSQELPATGPPIILGNTLRGRSTGGTLAFAGVATRRSRWNAAYTYTDTEIRRKPGSRDIRGGVSEANDARHQLQARSLTDIRQSFELDVMLRYVSALPNPHVPAYAEMDLRFGWHVTPQTELSLIGRNLLKASHPEFGAADVREHVERSVYARAIWRF